MTNDYVVDDDDYQQYVRFMKCYVNFHIPCFINLYILSDGSINITMDSTVSLYFTVLVEVLNSFDKGVKYDRKYYSENCQRSKILHTSWSYAKPLGI